MLGEKLQAAVAVRENLIRKQATSPPHRHDCECLSGESSIRPLFREPLQRGGMSGQRRITMVLIKGGSVMAGSASLTSLGIHAD